jgi:hypothetical protein
VLNKVDSLWDELKKVLSRRDNRQVESRLRSSTCRRRCFPFRPEGLLARSAGNALLRRDGPGVEILCAKPFPESATSWAGRRKPGSTRSLGRAQLLTRDRHHGNLRTCANCGRQDVVTHMMARVNQDKKVSSVQRFGAVRTYCPADEHAVRRHRLGPCARTRAHSPASGAAVHEGVRGAMSNFFTSIHRIFADAGRRANEIHDMMQAMYTRFATENRTTPYDPPPFTMLKYQKEIDRLERAYNQHFNTLWNMLSKAKFSLTQGFFETVASRVKHVYDAANGDVEAWLRSVMSPLESQSESTIFNCGGGSKRQAHSRRDRGSKCALGARAAPGLRRGSTQMMGRVAAIETIVVSATLPAAANAQAGRSARFRYPPKPALLGRDRAFVLGEQDGMGFDAVRFTGMQFGTNLDPLRLLEVADAFGALPGVDDVDLRTLRDGVIRALRLADVAVDAFVGDHQGHRATLASNLLRPSP